MATKKKKPEIFSSPLDEQVHYDITTGCPLDMQAPVDPAPETAMQSDPVEDALQEEYGRVLQNPSATELLVCVLRELVRARLGR